MQRIILILFFTFSFFQNSSFVFAQDRTELSELEDKIQLLEIELVKACNERNKIRKEYKELKNSGASKKELGEFRQSIRERFIFARQCKDIGKKIVEKKNILSTVTHNYMIAILNEWKPNLIFTEKKFLDGNYYIQNYSYVLAFDNRDLSFLKFLLEQEYRPIDFCEESFDDGKNNKCYIFSALKKIHDWRDGGNLFSRFYFKKNFLEDLEKYKFANGKYYTRFEERLYSIRRKHIEWAKCSVRVIKNHKKHLNERYKRYLEWADVNEEKSLKIADAKSKVSAKWDAYHWADYLYKGLYLHTSFEDHQLDGVEKWLLEKSKDSGKTPFYDIPYDFQETIRQNCTEGYQK